MSWIRPFIASSCAVMTLTFSLASDGIQYPNTKRVDHTDDYHGTKVADPYRWLENDVRVDAEVKAWVESQNKITSDYLSKLPERDNIKQRLTELWK